MKWSSSILVSLFFCFSLIAHKLPTHVVTTIVQANKPATLLITTPDILVVTSPDTQQQRRFESGALHLACDADALWLNGIPLTQKNLSITVPHGTRCNGMRVQGTLRIQQHPDGWHIVLVGSRPLKTHAYAQYWRNANGITDRMQRWTHSAQHMHEVVRHSIHEKEKVEPKRTATVRVLLADQKDDQPCKWELYSGVGFLIYDPTNPKLRRFISNPDLVVTRTKGVFFVNGKPFSSKNVYIISEQGYVSFNDRTYQGDFLCTVDKGRVMCINMLDLESYVSSVLSSESWPGWPLEVNKTFAIMTRSYAMAQALQAQKNKRMYHVKSTNEHQTYRGIHNSDVIKQAVQQTEGVILAHDKKPILAMFDSCCGGVIPMHIKDGVDFAKAPYLARSYACDYCKGCKLYAWQAEYDFETFAQHLRNELKTIKKLRGVQVVKRDKAGVVQEVVLRGANKIKKIAGRQLYSLLRDVKSFCYDITHNEGKVVLSGKGYGHHIGLCQWGAREMVRHGFDHKHILDFYYPGTTLVRMT